MIKMWLIGLIESIALDVSDNADNRHPRRFRCWTTSLYSQPHRISIVEVTLCECFVNQDNLGRLPVVCVSKEPAAFQRCLDRAEVIGRDHANLRSRDIVVSDRVTFDGKATGIMWTNERNTI